MNKIIILFLPLIILTGCVQKQVYQDFKFDSEVIEKQVVEGDKELIECIEENKAHLISQKSYFVKGELIIGFNDDISINKAKSVIQSYGLTLASDKEQWESEEDWEYRKGWQYENIEKVLIVSIPDHKELKYKCILEKDENIKYVETDKVYSL